jgi:hypothetical protein
MSQAHPPSKTASATLKLAWTICVKQTGAQFLSCFFSVFIAFVFSFACSYNQISRALDDIIVSRSFAGAARESSPKSPFSSSAKFLIKTNASPASSDSPVPRSSPLKLAPLAANRSSVPVHQSL